MSYAYTTASESNINQQPAGAQYCRHGPHRQPVKKKRQRKSPSPGKDAAADAHASPATDTKQKGPALPRTIWWRSRWLAPSVVFVVAACLYAGTAHWDTIIFPDSAQYLRFGEDIQAFRFLREGYTLADDFFMARKLPPVYPALTAIGAVVTGDFTTAAILVSIVMSLGALVAMFIWARALERTTAGLVAVAFTALNPAVLRYSAEALTEATFGCLLIVAGYVTMTAILRQSARWFAAAGAACMLVYLTREVGATCVVGLVGGTVLHLLITGWRRWRQALKHLLLALVVFVMVGAPYFLYIRVYTGSFSISLRWSDQYNLKALMEHETEASTVDAEAPASALPVRVVNRLKAGAVNTWRYTRAAGRELGKFVLSMIALASVGTLILAIRRRDRETWFRELFVVMWLVQGPLAIGLLTFRMVDVRYMYATTLMVIMFTAIGLCRVGSQVAQWLQRSCNFAKTMAVAQRIGGVVAGVAVVLAAVVIGWPAIGQELERYESDGLRVTFASGIREFTDTFQQTYPDQRGKVVVSRYPVTAYYLEAASTRKYPQTMREIYRMDADLLVADSWVLRARRPQLLGLAYGRNRPHPGKRLMTHRVEGVNRTITVYDLRRKSERALAKMRIDEAADQVENEEFESAIAILKETVEAYPNDAVGLRTLGELLVGQKRLIEAIPYLQRTIELDPSVARVHNNLGACYGQRGDLAAAIQSFETALAVDPEFEEARANLEKAKAVRD